MNIPEPITLEWVEQNAAPVLPVCKAVETQEKMRAILVSYFGTNNQAPEDSAGKRTPTPTKPKPQPTPPVKPAPAPYVVEAPETENPNIKPKNVSKEELAHRIAGIPDEHYRRRLDEIWIPKFKEIEEHINDPESKKYKVDYKKETYANTRKIVYSVGLSPLSQFHDVYRSYYDSSNSKQFAPITTHGEGNPKRSPTATGYNIETIKGGDGFALAISNNIRDREDGELGRDITDFDVDLLMKGDDKQKLENGLNDIFAIQSDPESAKKSEIKSKKSPDRKAYIFDTVESGISRFKEKGYELRGNIICLKPKGQEGKNVIELTNVRKPRFIPSPVEFLEGTKEPFRLDMVRPGAIILDAACVDIILEHFEVTEVRSARANEKPKQGIMVNTDLPGHYKPVFPLKYDVAREIITEVDVFVKNYAEKRRNDPTLPPLCKPDNEHTKPFFSALYEKYRVFYKVDMKTVEEWGGIFWPSKLQGKWMNQQDGSIDPLTAQEMTIIDIWFFAARPPFAENFSDEDLHGEDFRSIPFIKKILDGSDSNYQNARVIYKDLLNELITVGPGAYKYKKFYFDQNLQTNAYKIFKKTFRSGRTVSCIFIRPINKGVDRYLLLEMEGQTINEKLDESDLVGFMNKQLRVKFQVAKLPFELTGDDILDVYVEDDQLLGFGPTGKYKDGVPIFNLERRYGLVDLIRGER